MILTPVVAVLLVGKRVPVAVLEMVHLVTSKSQVEAVQPQVGKRKQRPLGPNVARNPT
jgi:hypothetical protein